MKKVFITSGPGVGQDQTASGYALFASPTFRILMVQAVVSECTYTKKPY